MAVVAERHQVFLVVVAAVGQWQDVMDLGSGFAAVCAPGVSGQVGGADLSPASVITPSVRGWALAVVLALPRVKPRLLLCVACGGVDRA